MFESLTEAQSAAVQTIEGPLLILAGPGSGKTRVVTHRTAYMVQQGINPRKILTLTFTNKAADEMQTRLNGLVADAAVWTSTFHKFCSKTLREHGGYVGLEENFTILDSSDSQKALKQTVEEHNIELFKYSESQILNKISELKNQLLTPEDFKPRPGVPIEAIAEKLYPLYQQKLLRANAVDFDDLLLHVAKLLMNNPDVRADLDARHEYISVDEYQDTNFAQYMILKMLSVENRNLAVTGDPDQSIYGWRGANIRNILDFEKDFPETKIVKLEKNYRSTPDILGVADHLIEYNTQRKQKKLYTDNSPGCPVRLVAYPSQKEEANQIAEQIYNKISRGERRPQDIALFYRTNALSRTFEHALKSLGIPFQIVKGHEFYQRREVKDVIAYLHLINNPQNDVAFERIINVPSRKIGKVTIDRIKDYAYRNRMCLLEAAWNCEKITTLKGIARKNVQKFADMMVRLREKATDLVSSVITHVYRETGYRDVLLASEHVEDEERAANLDELLNAAHEFDLEYGELGGLDVYLDQASLVSDVDAWETNADKVTLMTLHAAKGLEFPLVYIVALEDGILPHARSMETDSEIEEERRLFFVGITRAEQELQISRAMYRAKKGRPWPTIPSTFLMELPRESMEVHEPRRSDIYGNQFGFASEDDDVKNYFQDDEYPDEVFEQSPKQEASSAAEPELDAVPFEVFVDEPEGSAGSSSAINPGLLDNSNSPADQLPVDDSSEETTTLGGAASQEVAYSGTDNLEVFHEKAPQRESDPLSHDSASTNDKSNNDRSNNEKAKLDFDSAAPGPQDGPKLQIAAKLLSSDEPKTSDSPIRFPPDAFQENMLVSHPNYGVGRILAIQKAGSKQTANVEFVSVGEKKFVLSHAPLRPVVE